MNGRDITLLESIFIALVFFAGFYLLQNTNFIVAGKLMVLKNLNWRELLAPSLSLGFNVLAVLLIVDRTLGYRRQGGRLRFYAKDLVDHRVRTLSLGVAVIVGVVMGSIWENTSYGLSCFFLGLFILLKLSPLKNILTWRRGLPGLKAIKNRLTLGAVGEEQSYFDGEESPRWLEISQKALSGNILVTGSIGSGKTQGTILPWMEQVFARFRPNPAILALDPKGSFIGNVLAMAEGHGRAKNCICLGFERNGKMETFNPVYRKKALKDGRYIEIAAMIRSAAKNFSQGGHESPIWENAAFNLTKNVVAYCAAVLDYFTLRDCYRVMITADMESTRGKLRHALLTKDFDHEELYNINCAIEYFKEYAGFEDKFKSGVLVTATTFINAFQDYTAAKVFCPPSDKRTIKSMDEVVDNGQVLLFHMDNEKLSKAMGTFVKLHYQQSVLDRLKDARRSKEHLAIMVADEYQDLVSTSGGSTIGDDKICAKGREANFFLLAATQSINSLYHAIGHDKAAKELIQNFRTRIACHSSDIETINNFKELVGQEDKKKKSHSISELSNKTKRNFIMGGFDTGTANITESVSTQEHKEFVVTARDFSRLRSFEAYAQVYDGLETNFYKMYLKPYFLKNKRMAHKKLLATVCAGLCLFFIPQMALAFPNVCSVVQANEFNSCLDFKYSLTTCNDGLIPRPCFKFSYRVPQTFIEVMSRKGQSYFSALPGVALQLSGAKASLPFAANDDHSTYAYQARTLAVPFAEIPFSLLPCGGARMSKICFDAASEHLGQHWVTGSADRYQPRFLAYSLAPKACLIKGAVSSIMGNSMENIYRSDSPICSFPLPGLVTIYPPSMHPVCNGWGVFFPRTGIYHGASALTAALMVASRIKSIASEVMHSQSSGFGEVWQMISPGTSSCFREGQNVGVLETIKHVREWGRLSSGKLDGYLFTVWKSVSCVRDIPYLFAAKAAIASMKPICSGIGGKR